MWDPGIAFSIYPLRSTGLVNSSQRTPTWSNLLHFRSRHLALTSMSAYEPWCHGETDALLLVVTTSGLVCTVCFHVSFANECVGTKVMPPSFSSKYGAGSKATWPLKMGPIGCPETSATISLRCVTSHKSEFLIYTPAKACNYAWTWHEKELHGCLRTIQEFIIHGSVHRSMNQ
jgi:hypothetical protein